MIEEMTTGTDKVPATIKVSMVLGPTDSAGLRGAPHRHHRTLQASHVGQGHAGGRGGGLGEAFQAYRPVQHLQHGVLRSQWQNQKVHLGGGNLDRLLPQTIGILRTAKGGSQPCGLVLTSQQHLADELNREFERLSNQARFVQMIIDKTLVVSNKKKTIIVTELRSLKFRPFPKVKRAQEEGENEPAMEDEDEGSDSDYDYLLGMAIWSLTAEKASLPSMHD